MRNYPVMPDASPGTGLKFNVTYTHTRSDWIAHVGSCAGRCAVMPEPYSGSWRLPVTFSKLRELRESQGLEHA